MPLAAVIVPASNLSAHPLKGRAHCCDLIWKEFDTEPHDRRQSDLSCVWHAVTNITMAICRA